MLTYADLPKELPAKLGHYRLLRHLGTGWTSEVYEAELLEELHDLKCYLPNRFAVKFAIDKASEYPAQLTREKICEIFTIQNKVASRVDHPFILKAFPGILSDVDKGQFFLSELGCCSLEDVQRVNLTTGHALGMPMVKYVAAHLVVAVQYLHENNICWTDPMPRNVIIFSDFSLRITDIGGGSCEDDRYIDIDFLVGMLYFLESGDNAYMFERQSWLAPRLASRRDFAPLFYDMLEGLLNSHCFKSCTRHDYWKSQEDSCEPMDLASIAGSSPSELRIMMLVHRRAAYESLRADQHAFLHSQQLSFV